MALLKGTRVYSKETIPSLNFSTGRSTRLMLMTLLCFAAIMFLLGRHAALINSTSTSNTADRQTAKAFQCFSLATRHKGHPESCPSAKVQECEDTRPSLYVHTVVQSVAVGRQVFLPALN